MNDNNFKKASEIDNLVSNNSGLYCIRISDINNLPNPFNDLLKDRGHNIIYIGLASKSLKVRFLNQELRAKGNGTFFRSIGAVLGFRPQKGSLLNNKNKRNYRFSNNDEQEIIKWINNNLNVNWIDFSGDCKDFEEKLIDKYLPLLNISNNTFKLKILSEIRNECIKIANEFED